jgi:hypothetical protein
MTDIDDRPQFVDTTQLVQPSVCSGKDRFAGPTASYPQKPPPRLLRDVLSFEKRCRRTSIRRSDRSNPTRRRLLRPSR